MLTYLNYGKNAEELRWSEAEATLPPGHKIGTPKPLFRKITRGEIDVKIRKLQEIKKKG